MVLEEKIFIGFTGLEKWLNGMGRKGLLLVSVNGEKYSFEQTETPVRYFIDQTDDSPRTDKNFEYISSRIEAGYKLACVGGRRLFFYTENDAVNDYSSRYKHLLTQIRLKFIAFLAIFAFALQLSIYEFKQTNTLSGATFSGIKPYTVAVILTAVTVISACYTVFYAKELLLLRRACRRTAFLESLALTGDNSEITFFQRLYLCFSGEQKWLNIMGEKGYLLCGGTKFDYAFKQTDKPIEYFIDCTSDSPKTQLNDEYIQNKKQEGYKLACIRGRRIYFYASAPQQDYGKRYENMLTRIGWNCVSCLALFAISFALTVYELLQKYKLSGSTFEGISPSVVAVVLFVISLAALCFSIIYGAEYYSLLEKKKAVINNEQSTQNTNENGSEGI